jgi:hypothetical protein
MNNRVKWVVLLAMGLPSWSLASELYAPSVEGWGWFDGICPSIGAEMKYGGLNGKGNWRHEFPDNYPIGNLYLATRFHDFFAIEVGYEQSAIRRHTSSYGGNDSFFGNKLPAFSYERSAQMKGLHCDFNFLLCLHSNIEFLASVGVGNMSLKTKTVSKVGPTAVLDTALFNSRLTRRGIARLRLGLVYHLRPNIGIRALVGVDGTSHFRVNGSEALTFRNAQISSKPFRDMPSISIGFFIKYG